MAQQPRPEYIRYYSDGSAARKLEVQQPRPKTSLPKIRKKKVRVIQIEPVAMIGIVVALVMLCMMLSSVSQLRAEQQRLMEMQNYVAALQAENQELVGDCEEKIDLAVIEEQALSLGMIPASQAQRMTIQVSPPEVEPIEEPVSLWENISAFLEGLFA